MSDNWVVQNLENALRNLERASYAEIWQLTNDFRPQQFKGGGIWSRHGEYQRCGSGHRSWPCSCCFSLSAWFSTCGSFTDVKEAGTRTQSCSFDLPLPKA